MQNEKASSWETRWKQRRGYRVPGFDRVERRRITRVGGSLMIALPARLVTTQLHVQEGDDVFLLEVDDGILLTCADPNLELKMERHDQFLRAARTELNRLGLW